MATANTAPYQPYQLPVWDPNNPNAVNLYGYSANPYGGWDPNAQNGPDTSQMGYAPSGNEADVNPNASMEDIYAANRDTINTTGNLIGQEAGNQLQYYGQQQQQYGNAENEALNQLNATPGFTPDEASQINTDYSGFNTDAAGYAAQKGDPNAPVSTLNQGVGNEGAALGAYQSGVAGNLQNYGDQLKSAVDNYGKTLSGQVGQAENWSGDAANQFKTGVTGATQGLASGLGAAQSKFAPMDVAVNNPALGFDPNSTEKQMSDRDVNDLVTSAGTTVGNQFQTAEDTLERQAAAAGNSSPAALAAMRQQLVTQEAATAGDTMTNARIAANDAQYQRAAGIEQQREGATQAQTGFQSTAATTEEAAAQAAAGQAGQAGIAGAEAAGANTQNTANMLGQQAIDAENTYGQQNINAANTYGQFQTGEENSAGQFGVGQQNTQTNQQYGAQANAEQEAATRAQQANQQKYTQGTGSQQMTSAGAQATGNARIAGQGAYRSGVAQQQGLAQQGGQAAVQAQLGAYGTQTQGANSAASGQGNFEVGKPSFGDTLGKDTAGSIAALFADGGVAHESMTAKVGERGPEIVVPAGRYKSRRQIEDQYGMAA